MPKRTDIHSVLIIGAGPIMIDPEFADRTYIEPITPECVEKIIVRELDEMKKMGVPVGVAASRQSAANSMGNQRRSAETPQQTPHKLVLLPTLGGQTALNTAMALH